MKRTFICCVCERNANFVEGGKEYCGYHKPSRLRRIDAVPPNNLLKYRLRAVLTQGELSKAAGVSKPTISGIENLHVTPMALTCMRLARALGKDIITVFPAMVNKFPELAKSKTSALGGIPQGAPGTGDRRGERTEALV